MTLKEFLSNEAKIGDATTVYSSYDDSFVYRVGDVVSVDNFYTNRWNECAPGIHHFMNRQEAVGYVL